jgi:hypothetical protein
MSNKIEFSPAIPWVLPFDVQKRIQELRGYLDPKNPQYEPRQQHDNIRAVIQLYEDGKIDGSEQVCVMEGKIVTRQEMFEGTARAWVEVYTLKSLHKDLSNEWVQVTGRVSTICRKVCLRSWVFWVSTITK